MIIKFKCIAVNNRLVTISHILMVPSLNLKHAKKNKNPKGIKFEKFKQKRILNND